MDLSQGLRDTTRQLYVASGIAIAVLILRMCASGVGLTFLVWNLFLAWVPYWISVSLYNRTLRNDHPIYLYTLGFLWVLFLPNAPYIVTDFVHLGRYQGPPIWLEVTVLGAFAGVGLVLGFRSIWIVQQSLKIYLQRLGKDRHAQVVPNLVAVGVLLASGIGIFAGRVWRVNSWDVIYDPGPTLAKFVEGMSVEGTKSAMALIGVCLMVAYGIFTKVSIPFGTSKTEMAGR